MPPEKPYKRIEREEAERLGGRRIPHHRPDQPDGESPWLCIEVKARKKLPAWVKDPLHSARAKAKDNQLGIVVLHEMGERDSYIIISRKDFIDWFGGRKGK